MNIDEKYLTIIKEFLAKKISPYFIVLFGSAAKGKLREDSDIDIAFLSDQRFSDYEVFLYGQELANLLDREVDLIDLEKASTVFQAQVLSTGKVLYCSDEIKKMLFHVLVLKKYARLNEERQCILKKYEERGSL
ncbi:MAG: type VII toxin-antitoxin system MntA family adenylyltransferase antitoxin [Bacillota bacterium]